MKLKTISAFFLAALLTALPALAAEAPDELVPLGDVVGISVKSGGVEIAELSYIETESGSVSPAGEAGLEAGDVIVKAGARKVSSVSDIALALTDARGGEITVVYLRRGSERSAVIKPIVNNGVALIGIWAKDGISGIGTLTFFDPESGVFGALGHSVSEGAETAFTIQESSIRRGYPASCRESPALPASLAARLTEARIAAILCETRARGYSAGSGRLPESTQIPSP